MPSDNTLGAPTEGLGQNVTFAFSSDAGAPQLQLGDPGRINARVAGGAVDPYGSQGRPVAEAPESATMALLTKIGDAAVGEALKTRRTQAYISGMQRAMQGEAVTDIVNEQPWWSKLFGSSDVVEGARAYTGNSTAQLAAAQMTDDMPNLRTMDGPTAQQYFVKKVNDSMTGDAATDLSIQQALTKSMPGVMRIQAKEHYAWKQEQATAAENASFDAGAKNLQAQGESMVLAPGELQNLQRDFVSQQVPAAGRDLKNWQDAQMDRLIKAARAGQFHATAAAQLPIDGKSDGPSLLSTLKDDQQAQVMLAIERGQKDAVKDYVPSVASEMSDIKVRSEKPGAFPGTTAEGLYQRALTVNKTYMDKTGNSIGPYTGDELVNLRAGTGAAIITNLDQVAREHQVAMDKAQTIAQKNAAVLQKNDDIIHAMGHGYLYSLTSTPGYTNDQIDYTVNTAYRDMKPEDQVTTLVSNRGYVVRPIATERDNQVEAAVAGAGAYNNGIQAAYDNWHSLWNADPSVAAAYYPKTAVKMEFFQKLLDGGVSPEQAYPAAFVNPIKQSQVTDKDRKAVIETINSTENHWFGSKLEPGSVQRLSQMIDAPAAYWNGAFGDPKAAATRALTVLKDSGKVEIIGGYAWASPEDPTQRLGPYLTKQFGTAQIEANKKHVALPYDNLDDTFNAAVDEFVHGAYRRTAAGGVEHVPGIDLGKSTPYVMVNPIKTGADGVPQFSVEAYFDDGHRVQGRITATMIQALAQQHKESVHNRNDQVGQPFNDNGTAERLKHLPGIVGAPK